MALIDGARVVIANSKRNRERTAAAQAGSSSALPTTEAGRQLADYWTRQAPSRPWHENLGGEADPCQCGRPMRWTGANTGLICVTEDHQLWARSAGARQRAAAYLASKRRPGADVAVRSGAEVAERTEAEQRAERVALAVRKAELKESISKGVRTCDPRRFELAEHQRAAKQMRAFLRAYEAEVSQAADVAELDDIARTLGAFARGADGYASPDGYTFAMLRQQLGAEAEARQQLAAQLEREQINREYQAEAQRRADAQQLEAEREAEREAKRERLAAAQRTAEAQRRPPPVYGSRRGAEGIGAIVSSYQDNRGRMLARYGACQFQHLGGRQVIAERVYGIAAAYRPPTGPNPSYPTVRACRKHYAQADAQIEQQLAALGLGPSGYRAYYWPLGDAA